MLIDASYFVGELNIPNTDKPEVLERLNWFIAKYEVVILRDVLGTDLYREFMTVLGQNPKQTPFTNGYDNVTSGLANSTVDDKWKMMLNGIEYLGLDARMHKWQGFIASQDDTSIPKSILANGIYCYWLRNNASFSMGTGEKVIKSESSVNVSSVGKYSNAWNEMCDWLHEMIWFLDTYSVGSNPAYTPTWWLQNRYYLLKTYQKVNLFNI
jgi:hypothetical protein